MSINTFTAEEIRTLESTYRRIGVIPHADGEYEIVIKPAEKLQWRDFRAAANDESRRPDAQEHLIKMCVVAVAYGGKKMIALGAADVAAVRALLDELLADWPSGADGAEVSRMIFKVNGQAGARAK